MELQIQTATTMRNTDRPTNQLRPSENEPSSFMEIRCTWGSVRGHGGAIARGEHAHSVRRQNRGDDEAGIVDEPVNGVAKDVCLRAGGSGTAWLPKL